MPTENPTENPTNTDELVETWALCLPDQRERGQAIIDRYAEPQRRYHDTRHLASVLAWIDRLAGDHDLFLVRLAAFFHDAVYAIPPGQVSNEEASARLALKELSRAGLEQEDLNEVARLVRLTATHAPGPRDPEGELLCDADLAVLAGSPEEYAGYVAAVTEEYAFLPREVFAAGRFEVLTRLQRAGHLPYGQGTRAERTGPCKRRGRAAIAGRRARHPSGRIGGMINSDLEQTSAPPIGRPAGGGPRSSTRSIRGPSPTATATGRATCRGSSAAWTTWPNSASTCSGCPRSTAHRWTTTATTSATTKTSIPPSARWRSSTS